MELDECRAEVIRRGFPELAAVDIDARYMILDDAYGEFTRHSRRSYLVEIDTSLRKAKSGVLLGVMSHELAHITREISMGQIHSFFDKFLWNHVKKYQTRDERNTDLLVVERGLGRELLDFLKYADKRREAYTSEEGLTVKELEDLLKRGVS